MTLQPLISEPVVGSPAFLEITPEIDYPDSDGNPMSDNTEQYRWIVMIKENLEIMYADDPNVFIAGDLLWYPVRYTQKRTAPDVMVAFGRPKGKRGSYRQWMEDDIPPQVAFEILSPSNKDRRGLDSLEDKLEFYQKYGIQEYYIYDPDDLILDGWQRQGDRLFRIPSLINWVSPLLGIRFDWVAGEELVISRPDGQRFLSPVQLAKRLQQTDLQLKLESQHAEQESLRADRQFQRAEEQSQRAEEQSQRAEQERQRAEQESQRAEQESQRAEQESQRAEQESQRAEQESQRAEQESQRAEQESQRAEQESQRAEQERQRAEEQSQRAEQESQRAEEQSQRAEQESQRAEQERQRADRLAEKLKALGIDAI